MNALKRCRFNEESGFSIIELVIVLIIMLLILGAITSMIRSGAESSSAVYNLKIIQEDGSEAITTMVRQIRLAAYLDPVSTQNSIIFAGDFDGDGTEQTMGYDLQNGYLRKMDPDSGSMMDWIPETTQIVFKYWYWDSTNKQLMQSGNPVGSRNSEIIRIDISLSISRGALNTTIDRTFNSTVNVRNELRL
ncbi:MAG: hypothetical protein A2Z14_14790 [Chloroflexi bacterium RBG_16_48_8]|nr:MAG: hypothetical protein A2Z74_02150 [Chloroflexi bacterium RBG_13_46_9]OGO15452.1 MAG: hypothetical protein A2Z14_14790 [Chloroflexi bacterium RBG_16_48_8]